jgi:hypothetical protein
MASSSTVFRSWNASWSAMFRVCLERVLDSCSRLAVDHAGSAALAACEHRGSRGAWRAARVGNDSARAPRCRFDEPPSAGPADDASGAARGSARPRRIEGREAARERCAVRAARPGRQPGERPAAEVSHHHDHAARLLRRRARSYGLRGAVAGPALDADYCAAARGARILLIDLDARIRASAARRDSGHI